MRIVSNTFAVAAFAGVLAILWRKLAGAERLMLIACLLCLAGTMIWLWVDVHRANKELRALRELKSSTSTSRAPLRALSIAGATTGKGYRGGRGGGAYSGGGAGEPGGPGGSAA